MPASSASRTAKACLAVVALSFLSAASADAAGLRVFASNGVKAAIQALTPQLEKASGGPLAIEFSTTADLRQRIEKGEPFDVAILTDDAMSALAKAGKLSPMQTRVARVGIGVGYRKGAQKPDVTAAVALKQSLLNAKAIAYTPNGASFPTIDKLVQRLGIAKQFQQKSRLTGPGAAPAAVANGEADLVITLISEILPEPGVVLAGPLPSEFQSYLGFSAAPSPKAAADPHVAALIAFLQTAPAGAVYVAKGMQVPQ
jgi:molybdate transport system substrate-binding protein